MANTLNLGNGNWATKEDSLLAYNSENGNFKPLPFDFTRASSATVVNKAGLIETVESGEPRIDFNNDAKGALLLEPQRSNLLTYSEDFSDAFWSKSGASVVGGKVSPSGDTSAFKLVESATTAIHKVFENVALGITTGTVVTASVYAKAGERSILKLQPYIGTKYIYVNFDLSNGTIGLTSGDEISKKIELLSNGYYRCSITFLTDGTSVQTHFVLTDSNIAGANPSYTGDGTSGVYIFGAQLEVGSYATSYIPNFGNSAGATRVADASSQTVPSGIIGQTEGAMYIEIDYTLSTFSSGFSFLYVGEGTYENAIYFTIEPSGIIYGVIWENGTRESLIDMGTLSQGINKIALSYEIGSLVTFLNGVNKGSDTPSALPSPNKIYLGQTGTSTVLQKTNILDVKLYNTRLSNAELQALTK